MIRNKGNSAQNQRQDNSLHYHHEKEDDCEIIHHNKIFTIFGLLLLHIN